jgi:hypothetical protein
VADADIDGTWLIGDFVDFSVDPGAVDGAEADAPETASVLEVVAPFDEVVPDDSAHDDGVDPDVSARATPHPHAVATAAPTPKATANPPTRPTYAAVFLATHQTPPTDVEQWAGFGDRWADLRCEVMS